MHSKLALMQLMQLIHSNNVTPNFADQNVSFGMHTKISKTECDELCDECESTTDAKA
jgi:hypothetical protein